MSILIRDMEMPKRCFECPCLGEMFGYFVCLITAKDMRAEHGINISRPDCCPLIELPPHGRLIDADKLKAKFRHSEKDDEVDKAWNSAVRRIITQAETIIEPEGSEE